ncbi:MAG: CysB family transcriptional regulator [Alphaproteobacteria bacterium]|nr:CysB family transcriptional regulator [Alphaproteobacteria bacterium]
MIRSLEQEMGAELLVRSGPRISGMTAQGSEILSRARQILNDVTNLKLLAKDQSNSEVGVMKIGTTHTQACYGLVDVVKKFNAQYPKVDLHIHQASPKEIIHALAKGELDIGVNAAPPKIPANIILLDAYLVERCIIAPLGHPILKIRRPTLEDLAKYPFVTYDEHSQTGVMLHTLFETGHVQPRVAVRATNSTVVLAYVAAGIGIAVLQKKIYEQESHRPIRAIDANHLFPPAMTKISLRRDAYLRGFMYEFIAMVSPRWTKAEINKMKG